jgi:hypothetical protein
VLVVVEVELVVAAVTVVAAAVTVVSAAVTVVVVVEYFVVAAAESVAGKSAEIHGAVIAEAVDGVAVAEHSLASVDFVVLAEFADVADYVVVEVAVVRFAVVGVD